MEQLRLNLVLDREMLRKVAGYYLYRSQEEGENGTPVVSGVYIQRETIGENPPENMRLLLEWE